MYYNEFVLKDFKENGMAYDVGTGIGGGIGGAGVGAGIGSIFGPIGTGVGALIGGAAGLIGGVKPSSKNSSCSRGTCKQKGHPGTPHSPGAITGSGGATATPIPRFTPAVQNEILKQLMAANAPVSIDKTDWWKPVEARARRQFSTSTIPSLAERFTALGSGGAQKSSAFQGALGSAASDLESQLAALRAQYGQQQKEQNFQHQNQAQQQQIMKFLGLAPLLEQNYLTSRPDAARPGFWETAGQTALSTGIQGGGELAKSYLMNKIMGGSQSSPSSVAPSIQAPSTNNYLGGGYQQQAPQQNIWNMGQGGLQNLQGQNLLNYMNAGRI